MKKFMKALKIIAVSLVIVLGAMFIIIGVTCKTAMEKQVNAKVDMNQVKDGN